MIKRNVAPRRKNLPEREGTPGQRTANSPISEHETNEPEGDSGDSGRDSHRRTFRQPTSLTRKKPPRRKRPGPARKGRLYDEDYKAFISEQTCACHPWISPFPVEAAHVGLRGLGQKCSDRETIPLCAWHHRIGPSSAHVLGRHFWQRHGLDRKALIAYYQELYSIINARKTIADDTVTVAQSEGGK